MPVWPISPVQKRPRVTLTEWAAFEVPLNGADEPWTRHLAGWSCEGEHGQVCSPIEAFDPSTGQCVTASGRVYRLLGRPGLCPDGRYVWTRWKDLEGIQEERDVSAALAEAISAAQPPSAGEPAAEPR
jgi:hypothetical protein